MFNANTSNKFINYPLVILFIFVATLPMSEFIYLQPYRSIFLLMIIIILVLSVGRKIDKFSFFNPFFIMWIFMGIFVGVSTVILDKDWMNFIFFLIIAPLIFFIIFPKIFENNINDVYKVSLIGISVYLLLSIILNANFTDIGVGYRGVLTNSNLLGIYAALSILLATLVFFNEGKKIWKIYSLFIIILGVFFLSIAMSRTALLAVTISLFLYFALIFMGKFTKYKVTHLIIIYILSLFVLLSYILNLIMNNKLYENIPFYNQFIELIEKNQYYSGQNNITNGRTEIWVATFQDISFLGHGANYFTEKFGLAAHNSFVQFLGVYGIVASGSLILIFILALYFTIILSVKKNVHEFLALIVFLLIVNLSESFVDSIGLGINVVNLLILGVIGSMLQKKLKET